MASVSQSSIDCGFGSGMASIDGSLWLHCRPQLGQFNTEFFFLMNICIALAGRLLVHLCIAIAEAQYTRRYQVHTQPQQ